MAPEPPDPIQQHLINLAQTNAALVTEVGLLKVENARREEREKRADDRFAHIEKSLDSINSTTRGILLTFIGALLIAFVGFIVKGGLTVP